jgi:hypothetical protein
LKNKFVISGFISKDPIHFYYSTFLKKNSIENKDDIYDWVKFTQNGTYKIQEKNLFAKNGVHNAQIILYKKVEEPN